MPPATPTGDQLFQAAQQHHAAGRLPQAEILYRRLLEIQPDHAAGLHYLGILIAHLQRHDAGLELIRRSVEMQPLNAAFLSNYCNALRAARRFEDAVAACRQALALDSSLPEAHNNLGLALQESGALDEAAACFARALALHPGLAEVHFNLGNTHRMAGRLSDAKACFQRALALQPDAAHIHANLGNALRDAGDVDAAAACYQRSLALAPNDPEVHFNLGLAREDAGALDEALAHFRHALTLDPALMRIHSHLLLQLNSDPHAEAAALFAESQRWRRQFAQALELQPASHPNDRSPSRRLRIGYVSADFRNHPVAHFLLPLLRRHDRAAVEIFLYAGVSQPDATTTEFQSLADHWRSTLSLSDEQLARQIRHDAIDILVDLQMHTEHHRLLAFARRPAPVQLTWLSYPGTTGLHAMQYRLTDPHLDPPATNPALYAEESLPLPHCFWCYHPASCQAQVNPLPALSTGHITFGCCNAFAKVSPPTLALWRDLLQAVPHSRLALHAPLGEHRQRVLRFMADAAIAPERIQFHPFLSRPQYFAYFHNLDIVLDPFPWNGGTTTCDALWMGLPVITLAGSRAAARGGVSILTNVGLPELIAQTPPDYVRIAAQLAADLPRLAALRSGLREKMRHSPLMDAPRFARDIESAYRHAWQTWCASAQPATELPA